MYKYTALETARTIAKMLDKYKAGELTEGQARMRLHKIIEKRENNIFCKKQYRATFVQVLGKRRLEILKQLIETKGL